MRLPSHETRSDLATSLHPACYRDNAGGTFPEEQQKILREVVLAYRRVMRAPTPPTARRSSP